MKRHVKRRYVGRVTQLLKDARHNDFTLADWLKAIRSISESIAERRQARRFGVDVRESEAFTDSTGCTFTPVYSRKGKPLYWTMEGTL